MCLMDQDLKERNAIYSFYTDSYNPINNKLVI